MKILEYFKIQQNNVKTDIRLDDIIPNIFLMLKTVGMAGYLFLKQKLIYPQGKVKISEAK